MMEMMDALIGLQRQRNIRRKSRRRAVKWVREKRVREWWGRGLK